MSAMKAGFKSACASMSGREIMSIKLGKLVERIASAGRIRVSEITRSNHVVFTFSFEI